MALTKDDKCLICLTELTPLRSPVVNGLGESEGGECLEKEIQVMTLLGKMLGIRTSFLEKVLESSGGRSPSLWGIKLCGVCFRVFEEGMFVCSRLRRLNREFEGLGKVLRFKMVESGKEALEGKGRSRRGRKLGDESVCDRIRGEFASSCKQIGSRDRGNVSAKVMVDPKAERVVRDPLGDDMDEDDKCNDDGAFQDMDFEVDNSTVPSPPVSDGEAHDSYLEELELEDDEEFVPKRSRSRVTTGKRRRRPKKVSTGNAASADQSAFCKAVKMENGSTYQCSSCDEVFDSLTSCEAHILLDHYRGALPENTCPVCGRNFKRQPYLRIHIKNRHPNYKLPTEEILERFIEGGIVSEITYDIVPHEEGDNPIGEETLPGKDGECEDGLEPLPDNSPPKKINHKLHPLTRATGEPPPNRFSVPIRHTFNNQLTYIVFPDCQIIEKLPHEILVQLQRGIIDKECLQCDRIYPTEIQLKGHIQREHEGEKLCFHCQLCPKKFQFIGELLQHFQKIHVAGKNVCKTCGKRFGDETLLKAHIQRAHFGVTHPYKCVKCGTTMTTRAQLNKHMKRKHKLQLVKHLKPRKRPQTLRQTDAKTVPRRPVQKRVKYVKRGIPCELCKESNIDVKFKTDQDLDTHIKRKHMGIKRPYTCQICNKRFVHIDEHMKTHTVRSDVEVTDEPLPLTGDYVCHTCNKSYPTKSVYEQHLRGRNHQNVRPFVCEICSEPFATIRTLENHQSQKHHQELNIQPSQCQYCNKILSSERTLNHHIQVCHTKDAAFKCPYCDICSASKTVLDKHINIKHTKAQTFMCPHCPKTFLWDNYLKNHLRTHTGEKPYECTTCSKKFSDMPTYKRHVEAHSNIVHTCSYCDTKSTFKTRHALRCHMRQAHKTILDQLDEESRLQRLAPSARLALENDQAEAVPVTKSNLTADFGFESKEVFENNVFE